LDAKDAFDKAIARNVLLLELYDFALSNGKVHSQCAMALRACVVLSVGAVDMYFHEKLSENVVPAAKRPIGEHTGSGAPPKKIMPKRLRSFQIPLLEARRAVEHAQRRGAGKKTRPFNLIRDAIDTELYRRPIQTVDDIALHLSLIGVEDFWGKVARRLSVSKDRLTAGWATVVRRRNQIAHQADMPKGKRRGKHKLNLIGRKYAETTMKLCQRVVTAANEEIDDQIR
jgi:hypothetical protein